MLSWHVQGGISPELVNTQTLLSPDSDSSAIVHAHESSSHADDSSASHSRTELASAPEQQPSADPWVSSQPEAMPSNSTTAQTSSAAHAHQDTLCVGMPTQAASGEHVSAAPCVLISSAAHHVHHVQI